MKPHTVSRLERIKKLKSDNSFEKADSLTGLAIQLSKEGKREECAWVLELASEDIIMAAVAEEKPRELCKIARIYSEIGRLDKAGETIKKALTTLEEVRGENPWKFTNYLCYVAYEMVRLRENGQIVQNILDLAIASLGNVDVYYMKRTEEVMSLLMRFAENKKLLPYLEFSRGSGIPTNNRSGIPFEQNLDFLYSYIFLAREERAGLESLAEKNAGKKEILRLVSNINERWRRTVALAILSRLFLKESRVRKALEILNIASKESREIEFYWVRDNALEVISGTFLEIYHKNKDTALIDNAKNMISPMKDPWKKARAFCRIAETHTQEERFEQAAQEINYVHSHLLDRIDYRDRTAMSMFLIAEVLDEMAGLRNRWTAKRLRKGAFSILNVFDPQHQVESLDEYRRFIALEKGRAAGTVTSSPP